MNKPYPSAQRMDDIEPFHVMDLLAQARSLEAAGRSVVHMEVGEPDFPTPAPIVDAGIKALREGSTHYTPAVGLPALREALAKYYYERYGIEVSAKRIIVTPGASGALQLVMGVLLNSGDRVLMADPGYPCNRHFVRQYDGRALTVAVDATTGYQLTSDLLAMNWDERCVGAMLATPANPTGTLIPADDLREMARYSKSRGGVLIVDEIYHGLVYDTDVTSALPFGDNIFIVNSFSKYFGMTGWRLGWIVAPVHYVRNIDKLAQNIFLAAATPSQYAALAAFRAETREILEQRREAFQRRRDYLLPALRNLGFDIPVTPQGALYLYANCERFTHDSFEFCNRLLRKAGVAITPGVDFGHHRARDHVRLAYTTSLENLELGVTRLARFLKSID